MAQDKAAPEKLCFLSSEDSLLDVSIGDKPSYQYLNYCIIHVFVIYFI